MLKRIEVRSKPVAITAHMCKHATSRIPVRHFVKGCKKAGPYIPRKLIYLIFGYSRQ